MPHYTQYVCGSCGKETDKSNLVSKQVTFKKVGVGGKSVRSRTLGWLCIDECLPKDPDFNIEAYDSPGLKSPGRETVRLAMEELRHDPKTVSAKPAEVPEEPSPLLEVGRFFPDLVS